jgi:hypothetical protein
MDEIIEAMVILAANVQQREMTDEEVVNQWFAWGNVRLPTDTVDSIREHLTNHFYDEIRSNVMNSVHLIS